MAKASSKKTVVKRPVRHMKSDRVTSPTLSVEEQQCDTMVGALTHDAFFRTATDSRCGLT